MSAVMQCDAMQCNKHVLFTIC